MRETIYAVVDRLNAMLNFDNLPDAQEEYAEMFEMVSYGEEHSIKFYGQLLWCTIHDPIPEVDEEETIYNLRTSRVVLLRSAILHLTATIPTKVWSS